MFLLVACTCWSVYCSLTRPVIGILSQPTRDTNQMKHSYVAASYVKWIESGGGEVMLIPYDLPEEEHERISREINGLLIPGGSQDLKLKDLFTKTLMVYFDMAVQTDEFFPIFGTCMGFQALLILAVGDEDVLETGFDSKNLSLPLDNLNTTSRIFGSFPSQISDIYRSQPITVNQHHDGIELDSFLKNTKLMSFYDILSTNKDRNGRTFVSTMEAKKYPIYGVQYHPEKVSFEVEPNSVDISQDSTLANLAMSTFFVSEARRSTHRFPSINTRKKSLVYQYQPIHTDDYYIQRYFFKSFNYLHESEDMGDTDKEKCEPVSVVVVLVCILLFLAIQTVICVLVGCCWGERKEMNEEIEFPLVESEVVDGTGEICESEEGEKEKDML